MTAIDLKSFCQRQKIAFISQKDDAFASCIERQSLMFGRMYDLLACSTSAYGCSKSPEVEFQFQYSPYRSINKRHRNSALFNAFDQRSHVSRLVSDIQIDACAKAPALRLPSGSEQGLHRLGFRNPLPR